MAAMLRARIPVAVVLATLVLAGCGGSSKPTTAASVGSSTTTVTVRKPPPKPPPPTYPQLLTRSSRTQPTGGFIPAATWGGQTAAWVDRTPSGVVLLAFDQHLTTLHLHSGTIDAGTTGWRFGPAVRGTELRKLVAGFNGGFRLDVGAGGFESYGHTAVPLRDGLGSIVTYVDGGTDIGAWHQGVPAPGRQVASVRQNLSLLIDHGTGAGSVDCNSCWGATLGGVSDPARAALGIASDGRLIWAGGENLTVSALVDAMLGAHVARAVELDINPEWVAAYLYGHRGGQGPLAPVPALAAQNGIPGQFLTPWSRDFFTIVGR
jgi:hypothetical protein